MLAHFDNGRHVRILAPREHVRLHAEAAEATKDVTTARAAAADWSAPAVAVRVVVTARDAETGAVRVAAAVRVTSRPARRTVTGTPNRRSSDSRVSETVDWATPSVRAARRTGRRRFTHFAAAIRALLLRRGV